jgi:hypothetical protein
LVLAHFGNGADLFHLTAATGLPSMQRTHTMVCQTLEDLAIPQWHNGRRRPTKGKTNLEKVAHFTLLTVWQEPAGSL